ncbi:hypothetical protein BDZ45DRAFT_676895 [Acephala macrosclerotiorum]|nr:hypothetical protein BDZ45DRAFT_676895 [Acephala macrosclerotiorum]
MNYQRRNIPPRRTLPPVVRQNNSRAGAQAEGIKAKAAPYELLDLLYRIHPPVIVQESVDNMRKKEKSHVRRKERAALKPADHPSNQKRGHGFKINPGRQHETGKTLTEFTIFDQLAPELREMIWNFALNGQARAVKIIGDGFNHELRPTLLATTHRYTYRAKASYVPSALLGVNRESREIVNKQYPLAFGPQLCGRPIRFNFSRDILYFESPNAMINFYGGTLPMFNMELDVYGFSIDMNEVHNKVQHVAVGHIRYFKAMVGATLNQYKNLKTVILGAEVGDSQYDTHDTTVDYLTGDMRMLLGWERYQTFKTFADGNYPNVLRYRADAFKKKIDEDYKQFHKPSRKRLAALKVTKPIPKGLVECMAGVRINCGDN